MEMRLPLEDSDGVFTWELCDPARLLQLALAKALPLQKTFHVALQAHRCDVESPWRLVVGFDEYCPGNKFSFEHHKKIMCLYFSFLELGQSELQSGASWLQPIAVRARECDRVDGGWSHMMALFLKRLLFGQEGFTSTGVAVNILGEDLLIFARLGIIISDGDGLRLAFCWRGAGSFKPCLRHWNVLRRGSGLASRVDGYVETTCHDPSQFSFSTARLEESVDKVEAGHYMVEEGRMTQTFYHRMVQTEGFNYVRGGLPFDDELRQRVDIFGCVRIDWVHSAMQDGALNGDMHLLLSSVDDGYARAEAFCQQNWEFPKSVREKCRSIHRVFGEYRANTDGEHDKLKATASECLCAYMLMRHFVDSELDAIDDLADKISSFKAMCKAIDIIQATKKQLLRMRDGSVALKRALTEWLVAHKHAYGEGNIKPKCHWMFDVAESMHDDLVLIDQFIIERLHLVSKSHAERVDNTTKFERSVLAGALNAHIAEQRARPHGSSYIHGVEASLSGIGARLAARVTVCGMTLSTGDLVVHSECVGKVVACAEEDGTFMVLVKRFELVRRMTHYSSRWREMATLGVWEARSVMQDHIFLC